MKRILYLIVFSCLAIQLSYAQQVDNYKQDTTTLYQRTKGFYSDPIRAKWRQELEQNGDSWILKLYNKKDVLQEEISFANKDLEVRKGLYRLYQNGNIKEEGKYDKGYKVGLWKYYDSNHQPIERISYNWDKLHGLSFLYWDNGQVKERRNYVNGLKTGEWNRYYREGKLASKEQYDDAGNLQKGSYFNPSGDTITLEELMKVFRE